MNNFTLDEERAAFDEWRESRAARRTSLLDRILWLLALAGVSTRYW